MKILVTAFEPFNGARINPTQLILKEIVCPAGAELVKHVLPVEFAAGGQQLALLLREHRPDVVLSLGQAGNRPEICVERVAVNIDCVRSSDGTREIADNAGAVPVDVPIKQDGDNAYFATLPIWELVSAIRSSGVSAAVSCTAGTYVCNHVMYTALYEAARNYPNMKVGFIHVPFLPEQMIGRESGCSMEREDMLRGIQTAVDYLAAKFGS